MMLTAIAWPFAQKIKMTSNANSGLLVTGVDDVLITAELASRPLRNPDYEAESRALGVLAQEMATNPGGVLQKCAELVLELCHADSAGISILEPGGRSGILRLHAAAGGFAQNLHGTMSREASPCGTVMDRNCVLLFQEAERFFPALQGVEPRIYENLLAPWQVKGKADGTLWAVKHTPEGRFDGEDARILQSLARFAGAAYQLTSTLDQSVAKRRDLEQRTNALHETEARLQAAIDLVGLSPYTWNPVTGALDWDARLRAMWGLPPDAHVDHQVWLSGVHPEDRARVDAALVHCIDPAGDGLYAIDYRVIGIGDGIERWISTQGWTTFEHGRPVAFMGAVLDITERKRAEAALRESEERFRQFAHAAAEGAWIRDAETLDMEYVSPAASRIYGVEPHALHDGVQHWAGLIVPEDRSAALAHLEEARRGEVVAYEFRIQRPSDGTFRWIRSIDFPLFESQGRVQRVGGLAADVTEAKLAAEHSAVLLAELQHRVRNIMALLRSITNRTAEGAASVREYQSLLMGRLMAFARVQALLTRAANVSVGIRAIVHDEVSVQAQHDGQYVIEGPDVVLSPKAAEVLTLAIHELATNAVKYGALSVPTGRITVRWSTFEKRGGTWLSFDWTEDGAPARTVSASDGPRRRGFGTELIEARIPYELRGRGEITIEAGGARCQLEFPLQDGASILETGAPQRATVFGGAIDMTGEPDLTGRRVLVVEDDFYLATDAARALRGAGAEVMGLCATEADARAELEEQRPDAVVVDINLGPGPSFKLAEALKDRGIPFVFTTGYDADVIPEEFAGVERLVKPLQLRQIVGAIARLTAPA